MLRYRPPIRPDVRITEVPFDNVEQVYVEHRGNREPLVQVKIEAAAALDGWNVTEYNELFGYNLGSSAIGHQLMDRDLFDVDYMNDDSFVVTFTSGPQTGIVLYT